MGTAAPLSLSFFLPGSPFFILPPPKPDPLILTLPSMMRQHAFVLSNHFSSIPWYMTHTGWHFCPSCDNLIHNYIPLVSKTELIKRSTLLRQNMFLNCACLNKSVEGGMHWQQRMHLWCPARILMAPSSLQIFTYSALRHCVHACAYMWAGFHVVML